MAIASVPTRRYTAILDPDLEDGGYAVHVPALPGCHTQGDTREEAVANAREAILAYLDSLTTDGLPGPEEREPVQAISVEITAPSLPE